MKRRVAQLRTFLRTALHGLRASPVTSTVAVGTIAVSLLLVGAFALVVSNMERLLDRFGQDIRVSVYLEDGLSGTAQEELAERLRSAPGVESVSLVSKEEALERFREGTFGRASLLEGLDENPLPASLEVSLVPERRTAEGLAVLVASLEGLPGVSEFGYGVDWVEAYARAVKLIRAVAVGIGAVLGLATLLIVSNTIRLAVYARRDEIEILRLVGAGRVFVAVPFLIEGFLQGLFGGGLALALLFALFRTLLPALRDTLEPLLGYVTPAFLGAEGVLALLAGGALLGVLGSAAALLQGAET